MEGKGEGRGREEGREEKGREIDVMKISYFRHCKYLTLYTVVTLNLDPTIFKT